MIDVPVEVKDALREGAYKKNYRFVVLNEDGTESEIGTIDNDNLVSESVSIDERMCSGDTLKFGLCEGSSLEFQYFGKPNITGKRIRALIDVVYGYLTEWQDYMRFPITGQAKRTVDKKGTFRLKLHTENTGLRIQWTRSGVPVSIYVRTSSDVNRNLGEMVRGDYVLIIPDTTSEPYTAILQSYDLIVDQSHTIPMGFFDVKKCSRQASTGIIKATCYNKLQSDYLDAKANSKIIDVVDEGEVGVSGAATIDTILMKLLDGYAIKPEFIKANYSVPSNWIIQSGYTSDYVTPEDYQVAVPYGSIRIDISHINPNGAYRFFVDQEKIKDMLWDAMPGIAQVQVKNPRDPSDEYKTLFDAMCGGPGDYVVSAPFISIRLTSLSFADSCYPAHGDGDFTSEYVIKKYTENQVEIRFPMTFIYNESTVHPSALNLWNNLPANTRDEIIQKWTDLFSDERYFRIEVRDSNALGSTEITSEEAAIMPDVTLRDLQASVYELSCQFGQLDRVTDLFSGVELNHSRLYPADSLYPATDLYPSGAVASGFRSMYSKLWADEGNIHKWRYLIITYKGLDGQGNETDYTLQRTINSDGTDDYNMSDNWLFRNLVWTASQVGEYADAMVTKMQDITWFPFEMWCAGLPYLETGDEIEIPLGEQTYTSYILQRQLKGIQNLQDTYINGTLDIF